MVDQLAMLCRAILGFAAGNPMTGNEGNPRPSHAFIAASTAMICMGSMDGQY